jgi:hypothetical protein
MKSRLIDLLMLEAILMVAALLCAAAVITGIGLAIVNWPLSMMNVLLIAIAVLLWEILRVFRRIEEVGSRGP